MELVSCTCHANGRESHQTRNNSPIEKNDPVFLHYQDRRLRHPALIATPAWNRDVKYIMYLEISDEDIQRVLDCLASVSRRRTRCWELRLRLSRHNQ